MAETESPNAAVEKGNKKSIEQQYITTSFLAMNQGDPDRQEPGSSMANVENSVESGIFYLNPLSPKWNSEISEKCLEITSEEEDGIWVQSKDNGSRNFTGKGPTSEEVMTKLLKVKTHYLVPQTSNGNSMDYLGHISSTSSEKTWAQNQDKCEKSTAGIKALKQVKLLKVQKRHLNQQSPNGICGIIKCSDNFSSQLEERIWVHSNNGKIKLEDNPKTFCQVTSKLKQQKVEKSFLNPKILNSNGEVMDSHSDILSLPSEETEKWVQRKVNTEAFPTIFKEVTQKPKLTVQKLCSNQQTKQSTNGDLAKLTDCGEIMLSQGQEKDCFESKTNSKECVKDQEKKVVENNNQVTSKLKDLQVKENQTDGVKVSVNLKCKNDSNISRLLEVMKKRSEIDTEERPFKCPHCQWAFKKLCYLQSHITTHSGLKPHVCDICGKAYSHQGTLQQHKRLHTGERPYHCPFCDRSYIWSSDYRKHIRTHTGEKPYECKECGKYFIRSSDLRKHERNMHTNNKPFPCSHCDKTFNRPLSLKRHERKHLGERPFSCPDCGKKFALASRMAEHQKIHKGVRPFVCSVCAKCFTKSSNLTEHEAIHSGIRPHKCEECGVAFAMASRLVRHQYVHNKGKPYTCGGCGRNFNCLESLEQHQQLNCAGRIFVCVQCDKSFMCAEKLTQHMQHHNDETGPN